MEAGFLDRKLDPKRFQEYCLSREVAQDPTELWSSEDGTAAAGADEFSPSNRLLPISTRGVDVHLLAVRATGCVHIKDGTNFCVSQCDKESGLAKFETGWDYSSALHDTELLLGYISWRPLRSQHGVRCLPTASPSCRTTPAAGWPFSAAQAWSSYLWMNQAG